MKKTPMKKGNKLGSIKPLKTSPLAPTKTTKVPAIVSLKRPTGF